VVKTLVEYVKAGGNLLVIASGKSIGSGKTAQYYNPLLQPFGLSFVESVDLPTKLVVASDHPAVDGLGDFYHVHGAPVTVESGDVLGYVEQQPMMAIARYGKGKVVAAGLGPALMGSYLDIKERGKRAGINRELLARLASYLLSSASIAKEPI
jgi:uncharacterized membrane protein